MDEFFCYACLVGIMGTDDRDEGRIGFTVCRQKES